MRALIIVLTAWFGIATSASAWSETGHRVIGQLAYEHLTPKAKAAIDQIISKNAAVGEAACPITSLQDAAEFPDCVKIPNNHLVGKYQFMRTWHYNDITKCSAPLPPAVYCPDGGCATEAVKRAYAVLTNPSANDGQQLLALAQMAHFVGDLHQPLHVGDAGDKGGNDIDVVYQVGGLNHQGNLHHTWDADLVKTVLGNQDTALNTLRLAFPAGPAAKVLATDADRWAAHSHSLAVSHAYGDLGYRPDCAPHAPITIDNAYGAKQDPIIRGQILAGAKALAGVLNKAFE